MSAPDGDDLSRPGAAAYAAEWARAVRRLGFVPMSAAETERLLLAHAVRLGRALRAPTFSAEAGEEVGRALVEAHLTEPGVLDWSVRALGDRFLPSVLPARAELPEARDRV